uniref:Uncharacterized protein n=1 Tax=Solanum tuberosum TaxID=4113 RepID=M1DCB6_SOLTU
MMSNSVWDEYIEAHPKTKTLKTSPLPFPNLCTKIFEGSTATGNHGWSPSCTYSRPDVSSVSTTIDIDTSDEVEELDSDKNSEDLNNSPSQFSVSAGKKVFGKKRKSSSSQLEIDEKMRAALELLIKKNSAPAFEECMEKLDGLGWEEPLYSTAASIFCESERYKKA